MSDQTRSVDKIGRESFENQRDGIQGDHELPTSGKRSGLNKDEAPLGRVRARICAAWVDDAMVKGRFCVGPCALEDIPT